MKDDPISFAGLIERYGDPADSLAQSYFDALAMAREAATTSPLEAARLQKMAGQIFAFLQRYGKRPEMVEGVARTAETASSS